MPSALGKKVGHIEQHYLSAIAAVGITHKLKTDHGPPYVNKTLLSFLQFWHIKHLTGITYNPQGQVIVEHTLFFKNTITRTKRGNTVISTGTIRSCYLHFKFLDLLAKSTSTTLELHWQKNDVMDKLKAQVLWKDRKVELIIWEWGCAVY